MKVSLPHSLVLLEDKVLFEVMYSIRNISRGLTCVFAIETETVIACRVLGLLTIKHIA